MFLIEYEQRIAEQVILYLIENDKIANPTFFRIHALLYYADKHHLEHYGRFIFGDTYIAGVHSPIPENANCFLNTARDGHNNLIEVEDNDDPILKPVNGVRFNPNLLSRSERDSLQWVINNVSTLSTQFMHEKMGTDSAYLTTEQNNPISIETLTEGMKFRDEILEGLTMPM